MTPSLTLPYLQILRRRVVGQRTGALEVRRFKYLLRERDLRSVDGSEQLLRVSQYTGVTQRKRTGGGDEPDTRAESLVGYKCVEPNDFVVNIMLAWNGSMGVSQFHGIASPAYCVYRFRMGIHPWYFHHLLRSPAYKARIKAVSTGVVESRLRLYTDDLYRLEALFPTLPEQTAIVRFLDHADRRIRRYIRAKQKLIALLEEQKQAIIHQAVTGQIDMQTGEPYPAYKPSGLEWLGQIPEHWQVQRSKRVFKPRKELARQNDVQLSATQAYGVITQEDYEERVGRKVVKILRHLEKRRHVEIDDFVISMRSFQGGLEKAWASGCIRSSYIVLQPARKLAVGYFSYLFKSAGYISALQSTANFIRDGQDLNFENFCQVDLPFPPMAEQQRIGQTLDRIIADIGSAIEQSRRQIDLFGEYRTRLIADVVTGKLDVREAAAELPEEDVPGDAEESAEEYTIEKEVTV